MAICSVDGCWKKAHAKGWCREHWGRMHHYGRLEKIKGVIKGSCTVDGCNRSIKGNGFCIKHYTRFNNHGTTDDPRKPAKTKHSLYFMWYQRKQDKNLCEAWLDFWTFVDGVGVKPEGNYILCMLDASKPYGPDNFQWKENLVRTLNETDKEWWARKWKNRRIRNLDEKYERNLLRNFGLTLKEYNEILEKQNSLCALCEKEEITTKLSGTHKQRLAVDHCHKTGKIRELLCRRCNSVLGNLDEDISLIDKMKAYLLKHKEI